MMQPVKYTPGTIKAPQHTGITALAFDDTDHVRFDESGRLETIPPYSESSLSDDMRGRMRHIYAQRITGTYAGDYYFFCTHSHLYVEKNGLLYNITPIVSGSGTTLGTDPLEITDTETTVVVNHTAHGFADGDRIAMSGIAGALNGIPQAEFNKEHIITYIDANSYSIEAETAATSTDLTAGGASVVIKGQIAAGTASQATAAGFGAGDFGGGLYGAGGVSVTGVTSYPRIWSAAPFGNEAVFCPGDYSTGDGQKIYIWDGDTDVAPTVLTNAPTDCNWVLVVNNSIVALCGRTVKICALGAGTTWSGLLYRAKALERVDRLFAGHGFGEKSAVLHHSGGMVLLRYVGGSDLWDLSDIPCDDTLVSPYSSVTLGGAHLMRCTRGFYLYDGAGVKPIENSQNMQWIIDNENTSYSWHSFAVADQINGEAYFYFPTGTDAEPGDYVLYQPKHGSFTLGSMQRTAAQRTTAAGPGMLNEVQYFANSTGDNVTDIYKHFTRGAVAFSWYAKTAFFLAENTDARIFLRRLQPDSSQNGDITLEIYGKDYPQDDAALLDSHTITDSMSIIETSACSKLIQYKFSGIIGATLGFWMVDYRLRGAR